MADWGGVQRVSHLQFRQQQCILFDDTVVLSGIYEALCAECFVVERWLGAVFPQSGQGHFVDETGGSDC